jgi:hypothetical protein
MAGASKGCGGYTEKEMARGTLNSYKQSWFLALEA